MATELIINASLPETRIALMEDGEIQELLIERASGKGIVGNIYKGKVTRVLPGMQAAFVDIGLEKAAFLYVDDVYVHSEVFEEEAPSHEPEPAPGDLGEQGSDGSVVDVVPATGEQTAGESDAVSEDGAAEEDEGDEIAEDIDQDGDDEDFGDPADLDDQDDEEEDEDDEPVGMGAEGGGDDDNGENRAPEGTVSPSGGSGGGSEGGGEGGGGGEGQQAGGANGDGSGNGEGGRRRRHRRGRRGGRFRRKNKGAPGAEGGQSDRGQAEGDSEGASLDGPVAEFDETGDHRESDRTAIDARGADSTPGTSEEPGRPTAPAEKQGGADRGARRQGSNREEFKEPRSRDKRIRAKSSMRAPKPQVNIQDLLKEGQEVLVQVAKDPIATKGARLTCHISLPGRHLVCMPTIDHVGVSRRIDRDDERRRLRDVVERNRPKNLGFIVRTASGRGQAEKRIKQDIDYLTNLWSEIREKNAQVTAPALVYEDLNSVLRAIRDWVTEDIDKIVVDSRYHFNDIQRFVSHFMPSLKQKIELYHGDIPIFDAYTISTELARALERKVWLKSGGYIVIDQAEALVAIDVNTGRYVGKKNLEDTILKTNLEAVQEIAYQLRLRNCGGIIILDLIDMEKEENKQRVYRALEEALKKDRARPTILKISELGLVEMTRKRTRDTIVRALCEPCTHCEGNGYTKSKQTVAYEILREIERTGIVRDVNKILVQSHPDVIDVLAIEERETVDSLERRYRKQIYLQAIGDFHQEQFEVSGDQPAGTARLQIRTRENRDRDRDQRGGRDRDRGRNRDRDREKDNNREGGRNRDRDRGRGQRSQGDEGPPRITPVDRSAQQNTVYVDGVPLVPQDSSIDPNAVPGGVSPATGAGGVGGPEDEFGNEEDRLAFLRAQAAQDAALAKMRGAAGQAGDAVARQGGRPPQGGGEGGGRGGRRGRRGGRRGKFRGGRGDKGGQRFDNGGGNGGDSGGNGGGGEGGGGGESSGGGGGGDHSTPPA